MLRSKAVFQESRTCSNHGSRVRFGSLAARCCASADASVASRRNLLQGTLAVVGLASATRPQPAAAIDEKEVKVLCDADCMKTIEELEMVTTPSGLQYRDIVIGKGANPPTGYQVVLNYVAMTQNYRIFDNSLDKGKPYDIRVGSGAVVAGLDEGLRTMRPGGIRRLYVPGSLSFPKGLKAAAGRPSVPANSPVVFDVQLLYIPGLEDEEE